MALYWLRNQGLFVKVIGSLLDFDAWKTNKQKNAFCKLDFNATADEGILNSPVRENY